MDERIFARLATLLADAPAVLASVQATRGATPRKGGSRMLVTRELADFSVGGGLAEARVVAAARALLDGDDVRAEVVIDLTGRPGAAGVCGGTMRIALKRWGTDDRAHAVEISEQLSNGQRVRVAAADLGVDVDQTLLPDARLLIVGGGHCGLALYELARHLDFDLCVFDARPEFCTAEQYPDARRFSGDYSQLAATLAGTRETYAVLLNRDYLSDVESLRVLCRTPPAFLGMMGSAKRIAEVRAAVPEHAETLAALHAPVGLEIGAETPQEIAVSILAQVIQARRDRDTTRTPANIA